MEGYFFFIFNGPGGISDLMVPNQLAYLLKLHQTAAMYCHQVITSDILTVTHVQLCGTEPKHLPVGETQNQKACVLVIAH